MNVFFCADIDGLLSIFGFADKLDPLKSIEVVLQSISDQGVIVDQQDTNGISAMHRG